MKVLFFVDVGWASGAIHFDLTRYLHARGVIADVLDWSRRYGAQEMTMLAEYYDFFVTHPGQTRGLTDEYGIAHEKIIIVAHTAHDLRQALSSRPAEEFERFAGYGVVSGGLLQFSVMLGIARTPKVLRVGINHGKFAGPASPALTTVGYGSAMRGDNGSGLDVKRGFLAGQAAEAAGLSFEPAVGRVFSTMPQYYTQVGAVLVTSLAETVALPAMEAAAAGRLVIGTPTGELPYLASLGAALLAPFDAVGYHEVVVDTLRRFKDNPTTYVEVCKSAQEAAKQLDWEYRIADWIELFSDPAC